MFTCLCEILIESQPQWDRQIRWTLSQAYLEIRPKEHPFWSSGYSLVGERILSSSGRVHREASWAREPCSLLMQASSRVFSSSWQEIKKAERQTPWQRKDKTGTSVWYIYIYRYTVIKTWREEDEDESEWESLYSWSRVGQDWERDACDGVMTKGILNGISKHLRWLAMTRVD